MLRGPMVDWSRSAGASVLAATLASTLAACAPQPVIGPSQMITPQTPYKLAEALRDPQTECEITKETVVHCKVEGIDVLLGPAAAPTGLQLILAVPYDQPSCAAGGYHEKLNAFNAEFSMATAACISEKVLLISHRTHLFKAGVDRAELKNMVRRWAVFVNASAQSAGLLEVTEDAAPAPPPKKTKKKPSSAGGTI